MGAGATPSDRASSSWPKAQRLRRRPEFVAVQSTGRKVHGNGFVALVLRTEGATLSPLARGRIGFTVTKRIGNAVTRNRIKRRAREWLRTHGWVPAGLDVVFIAKDAAATQSPAALAEDLRRMVGRIAAC